MTTTARRTPFRLPCIRDETGDPCRWGLRLAAGRRA